MKFCGVSMFRRNFKKLQLGCSSADSRLRFSYIWVPFQSKQESRQNQNVIQLKCGSKAKLGVRCGSTKLNTDKSGYSLAKVGVRSGQIKGAADMILITIVIYFNYRTILLENAPVSIKRLPNLPAVYLITRPHCLYAKQIIFKCSLSSFKVQRAASVKYLCCQ